MAESIGQEQKRRADEAKKQGEIYWTCTCGHLETSNNKVLKNRCIKCNKLMEWSTIPPAGVRQ